MTQVPRLKFDKRIPELDGIRGLAILLVVFSHYILSATVTIHSIPYYIVMLGQLSWTGVDLFFVLSGLLIGGILIDAKDSANYFKVFYVRRSYRILPIYAVSCLIFYLILQSEFNKAAPAFHWLFRNPEPWYVYVTFTQNIWHAIYGVPVPVWLGVTWSLAVEEQFYLTLPFVIRFVQRRHLIFVSIATIIAAPMIRMLFYFHMAEPTIAPHILMPCRADTLMLGVLAAIIVRSPNGLKLLESNIRYLYLSLAILSFGMALLTLSYWHTGTFYMSLVGYTWIGLFYLCILLIAILPKPNFIRRIFRFTVLTKLGILAYGVYLFHQVVLGLCFGYLVGKEPGIANGRDGVVTLLAFILTLALAILSWIYIEKPLIKRGHVSRYEPGDTEAVPLTEIWTVDSAKPNIEPMLE